MIIADRVKEQTTTTGTGAVTVTGAMTAFKAFSSVCAVNDTCYITIVAVDSNGSPTGEWEVSLATYSAANTLTRTTVLSSSNANAAVNFAAGTKQVWIDLAAASIVPTVGFSAYLATTDQSITTLIFNKVALNAEIFDVGGYFDSATNYRYTPLVSGYYRFEWAIQFTAGVNAISSLYKNGIEVVRGDQLSNNQAASAIANGSSLVYLNGSTDYVELWGYLNGTAPKFLAGERWTRFSGNLVAR